MVEVFKTNVQQVRKAKMLVTKLTQHFPEHEINFDLSDCDKILRIEGHTVAPELVITIMKDSGYHCEILEG